MRIATWNVNSVRLRLDLVRRFLRKYRPDLVCLQETKTVDALFPAASLARAGYPHQAVHGQKSYNGVAILARVPFASVARRAWCGRDDCRHLSVRLENGVEVHDLYVPAGGDVPDPEINPKFAHKLALLREAAAWFAERRGEGVRAVLVGDLNVAPLETDVWSHKQLLKVVSHTPVEVELLERLRRSLDWVDAVRRFVPPERKLYSWWSYRARDWAASDRGRRLDHVWVTPPLAGALRAAAVAREVRGWKRPSDHAPVVVDLDL